MYNIGLKTRNTGPYPRALLISPDFGLCHIIRPTITCVKVNISPIGDRRNPSRSRCTYHRDRTRECEWDPIKAVSSQYTGTS